MPDLLVNLLKLPELSLLLFYRETVGAVIIPDSEPGIYSDLLKQAP